MFPSMEYSYQNENICPLFIKHFTWHIQKPVPRFTHGILSCKQLYYPNILKCGTGPFIIIMYFH